MFRTCVYVCASHVPLPPFLHSLSVSLCLLSSVGFPVSVCTCTCGSPCLSRPYIYAPPVPSVAHTKFSHFIFDFERIIYLYPLIVDCIYFCCQSVYCLLASVSGPAPASVSVLVVCVLCILLYIRVFRINQSQSNKARRVSVGCECEVASGCQLR